MNMNECDLPPEGCCFEHSSCGDDYCDHHNPYQILEMECSNEELIGQTIIGFSCFDGPWYDFELSDHKVKVDLFVSNNSLYAYDINIIFMKY